MSDKRDAALDAFLGLIAERGFAGVSLRDVAVTSGLGFAELHRLFPDKAALVAAFVARADEEVLAGTPAPWHSACPRWRASKVTMPGLARRWHHSKAELSTGARTAACNSTW